MEKKIICDVSSCDYNKINDKECGLFEVVVSCDGEKTECSDTSSTICQSFMNSGAVINDNEYEILSESEKEA